MTTGVIYIVITITIAFLIHYLHAESEPVLIGDDVTIYRYPTYLNKYLLMASPAIAILVTIVYSTFPPGEPTGVNLVGFAIFAICIPALPILAYIYFRNYRIWIADNTINIETIFRIRTVPTAEVAQIVRLRTVKPGNFSLFDNKNNCLAQFDLSIQDFDFLQIDIENHTRSPDVTLYKSDLLGSNWEEKTNMEHCYWHSSKGPPAVICHSKRLITISYFLCFLLLMYWLVCTHSK